MTKAEAMERWKRLDDDLPMLKEMIPIRYKSTGSKYGACGIRIDGTPDFIDAVLSHLKELISGENDDTRLQLSRNRVESSGNHNFQNMETDSECCYIRLFERGSEAKIFNSFVRAARERTNGRTADEECLD